MTKSFPVKQPRSRSIGVYVIALLAGVAAAWAAHEHIQQREQEFERQAEVEMVERVAIASDLRAGTQIQLEHLAVRDVPVLWAPENAIEISDVDQIVGKRIATAVKRGDILLTTHIALKEPQPATPPSPVADLLPPGRRAVTLPVGEIQAAAGLLRVGDFIDLFVSFSHLGQHVTAPLAQGVRVLALRSDVSPAVITLDASKEDAIKLVAARHTGALTAMLRSSGDTVVSTTAPSGDLAALIGLEHPVAVKRAPIPVMYGDRLDPNMSFMDSTSLESRPPPTVTLPRPSDSATQHQEVQEK